MQIEYIQTFLELARSRSFSRTAGALFVTQSTVSARIKVLEESLDRTLFIRSKRGVSLTRAGEQFHRYALTMSKLWQQAVQEVGLPEDYRTVFSLGATVSLWERLILQWIPWMRENAPKVALQVDASSDSGSLVRSLSAGTIDVAVTYEPRTAPGIVIERLMEEKLVLVSTRKRATEYAWVEDYVYVDWGEEFRRQHAEAFPEVEMPSLTVNLGELALRYVLQSGGSGYFPIRVVQSHLREKRLHRVARAPAFRRPVFIAYPADREDLPVMKTALRGLKAVSRPRRAR